MNTASRMESNGIPGQIHVSEVTMALLMADPTLPDHTTPEHWTPTGGVDVKGKGNMQTYLWEPPEGFFKQTSKIASRVIANMTKLHNLSHGGIRNTLSFGDRTVIAGPATLPSPLILPTTKPSPARSSSSLLPTTEAAGPAPATTSANNDGTADSSGVVMTTKPRLGPTHSITQRSDAFGVPPPPIELIRWEDPNGGGDSCPEAR